MIFRGISISLKGIKVEELVDKLIKGFYKYDRKIQIGYMVKKVKIRIKVKIKMENVQRKEKIKKEIRNSEIKNSQRNNSDAFLINLPYELGIELNDIIIYYSQLFNWKSLIIKQQQMSFTLKLWFSFYLVILASICSPIQQKQQSQPFEKDHNKSIKINLNESDLKLSNLKDQSSQNKQIPSPNPNSSLNLAELIKNQNNDDHKQKDNQCVYNLDYVDYGKKRILISQQQKENQQSDDEKILKQFNYIAYLKKYKPTQLNSITKSGKSIQDNFVYRMHTFIQNCKQIIKHNLEQNSTYLKGLNQFTDLSDFQFKKLYTTSLPMRSTQIQPPQQIQETGVVRNLQAQKPKLSLRYTTHIDWRCKCTEVYDQKLCRSCYAFAVIDSLEISLRIRNNLKQIYLSSQELISCAKAQFKLFGCSGGYPDDAYSYIKDKGIGSAQLYPINKQTLDGTQTQCDKNLINSQKYQKSRIFIRGYVQIKRGDCQQLVRVLKTQVVIVSLFSNGLRDYVSGTFVPGQKTGQPEHGVTLVGFHPKMKYLIKNSWGPKWGMNGYAYVAESSGVCRYSFYPILK